MQNCCDLEVDVNGEETFFVDREILASFSGRLLERYISKLSGEPRNLKVIFNDFPGGAGGFELIVEYCYNRGKIDMTPSNVLLLHCAAIFMEMNEDHHEASSLINQTRKYIERVHCFAWPELLYCLKQCQRLLPVLNDSPTLQHILECLVERLVLPCIPSRRSSTSSSDSSGIEYSGDISFNSTRSYNYQTSYWWFRDLHFLSTNMLKKVVEAMILQKHDQVMISSFLFYYQRVNFHGISRDEKINITETVINLLYLLNRNFVSLKGLLHILRGSSTLKLRGCCVNKLESMIGCKLDETSLDDLLVPSQGKSYAYDVNLVLRLLKHFLSQSCGQLSIHRLKKVGRLMDLYMVEVAPDPGLKPSTFVVLATTLPDFARDSHDKIFEAMDLYLKTHNNLREEETLELCGAVNYKKLSASGSLTYLAQNVNFPACEADNADLVFRQAKLRTNEDQILYSDELECCRLVRKRNVQAFVRKAFRKMPTNRTRNSENFFSSLTKGRSLPTLCS